MALWIGHGFFQGLIGKLTFGAINGYLEVEV